MKEWRCEVQWFSEGQRTVIELAFVNVLCRVVKAFREDDEECMSVRWLWMMIFMGFLV